MNLMKTIFKSLPALVFLLCLSGQALAENESMDLICTLTGYVTSSGHASAGLSCDNGEVPTQIIGLHPTPAVYEHGEYSALPTTFGVGTIILDAIFRKIEIQHSSLGAPIFLVSALLTAYVGHGSGHFISSIYHQYVLKERTGEVLDDAKIIERAFVHDKTELRITVDQAQKIHGHIEEAKKGHDFSMMGNSCVDFVQELFEMAGYKKHFTSSLWFFGWYGGSLPLATYSVLRHFI